MAHFQDDSLPIVVIALGVLVAAIPVVLLPDSSGPVAFAIGLMQVIAVVLGLSVVGIGIYSYRTGNLRPAVATGLTIIGLVLVGVLGAIVETTGGPLVPIWVWLVSVVLVIIVAVLMTNRVLDRVQQQNTG